MAIGVIFTGGTIGSLVGADGFISVDKTLNEDALNFRLLSMFYDEYDKECKERFVTAVPYSILSENLSLEHVNKLASFIVGMYEKYDLEGIVVTHGTDTLQYSAAFINYMCEEIDIPIVFVSSAYVLDDVRSNGLVNFRTAVEFIKCAYFSGISGVFAAYQNSDSRAFIHRADRLCPNLPFSADLYSVRDEFFAKYLYGRFMLRDNTVISKADDGVTCNRSHKAISKKIFAINEDVILRIGMSPGQIIPDKEALEHMHAKGLKAIFIDSYHSGTIRIDEKIIDLCDKAKELGLEIYVAGVDSMADQYETIKEYERLGINIIYDIAPIAAFCKLVVEKGKL